MCIRDRVPHAQEDLLDLSPYQRHRVQRADPGSPPGEGDVERLLPVTRRLRLRLRRRQARLDELLQLVERLAVGGFGLARQGLERLLEVAQQARAAPGEADANRLDAGRIAARPGQRGEKLLPRPFEGLGRHQAAGLASRLFLAVWASSPKLSMSRAAMSASTLRSSSHPAAFSPAISCEYEISNCRAAALIRTIHSERIERLRCRRSR